MLTNDDWETLYDAFATDTDARLIAPAQEGALCVQFKFGARWRECQIWQGYFDASLMLLENILEQTPRADNLIFPGLFNFRHAVEVALKWHISYAGGNIPKRAGHNLDLLIQAFRQTACDLNEDSTYISEYALDLISELALIDPRSIKFRYSTETNGSMVQIYPERWDLIRLYLTVESLSIWFDGLSGRIDLSRDEGYQAYLRGG